MASMPRMRPSFPPARARMLSVVAVATAVLAALSTLAGVSMAATAAGQGPQAVFDSLDKQFGSVTMGQTLRHVFEVTNKGDATLELLEVEASCGCTAALLSAKKIEPGQTGQVEVKVETKDMSGPIAKTVTVTTNDPRRERITLQVKAVSEPEFSVQPRSIYFGRVPRGQEASKELTISIAADKAVRVLGVESTDDSVRVQLHSESQSRQVKVLAVQKPDTPVGYHFGAIVIKTSSQYQPELRIPVRGMVIDGPSQ